MTFKVGDKVVLLEGTYNAADPGALATVSSVRDLPKWVTVTWDRSTNPLAWGQNDGNYSPDQFELVSNGSFGDPVIAVDVILAFLEGKAEETGLRQDAILAAIDSFLGLSDLIDVLNRSN